MIFVVTIVKYCRPRTTKYTYQISILKLRSINGEREIVLQLKLEKF